MNGRICGITVSRLEQDQFPRTRRVELTKCSGRAQGAEERSPQDEPWEIRANFLPGHD